MNWIKIIKGENSTLPHTNSDCLVCLEDDTIFMARCVDRIYWKFYFSDKGLEHDMVREKQVTHWMPLPSTANN